MSVARRCTGSGAHLASAITVSFSLGYLYIGVNSTLAAIVGCAHQSASLHLHDTDGTYMELGDICRMHLAAGARALGGVPPALQARERVLELLAVDGVAADEAARLGREHLVEPDREDVCGSGSEIRKYGALVGHGDVRGGEEGGQ